MKNEIYEIPFRAELCYIKNKGIILPENVPYLGMGASYIASCVFKSIGVKIFPEMASEYYYYLHRYSNYENGVLVSQSGLSSDTLWCATHFKSFVNISNNPDSTLSKLPHCSKTISLHAGKEYLIPTKTYINTLLVMYLGFGFDPLPVLEIYKNRIVEFKKIGVEMAGLIYKRIKKNKLNGIYILGNGPNFATAQHASLVISEITKKPVLAMTCAQYDHGHKETARNSVVIAINHFENVSYERTNQLLRTVKKSGGEVFELNTALTEEQYSPLTFSIPFFFASEFLAQKLNITNPFEIGNKITKSNLSDQQ